MTPVDGSITKHMTRVASQTNIRADNVLELVRAKELADLEEAEKEKKKTP